jgi:hypothetical protein
MFEKFLFRSKRLDMERILVNVLRKWKVEKSLEDTSLRYKIWYGG